MALIPVGTVAGAAIAPVEVHIAEALVDLVEASRIAGAARKQTSMTSTDEMDLCTRTTDACNA